MKTTAIMNLKGGVAKTITTINLAAILAAKHGKRVLVADADHQGNTSSFFKADKDGTTMREVLLDECESLWSENVQQTDYENIAILPANMSLAELDITAMRDDGRILRRLRDFLEAAAEDDAYDHVLVDMPPAFSSASMAALAAADEVIIPMKLDAFSAEGLSELLRQIASMRTVNPRLKMAGVLITMYQSGEESRQMEDLLRKSGVPVFKTMIRYSKPVTSSISSGKPLYQKSPRCAASIDYRRLVEEYLKNGGGRNGI